MRVLLIGLTALVVVGAVALYMRHSQPNVLEDCTLGSDPGTFETEPWPGVVSLEKVSNLKDVTAAVPYEDGMLIGQRNGTLSLYGHVMRVEEVLDDGPEQGLLNVHVHDGAVFTSVTNMDGDLEIRREGVSILKVDQPHEFHNGGDMETGPDGYMFISLGDGGPSGDLYGHPQNLDTFLGSIIRINPTDSSYEIPSDNPRVNGELVAHWVYGVRNAWRIHVDGDTLWFADVGNWCVEEINAIPATGLEEPVNFGWSAFEGTSRGKGNQVDHVAPLLEYTHSEGCAVIGGLVATTGQLKGMYLFSDYCSGWVYAYDGDTVYDLGVTVPLATTFAQTNSGETWIASQTDGVFLLR